MEMAVDVQEQNEAGNEDEKFKGYEDEYLIEDNNPDNDAQNDD